jgi:hypothetical protein
MRTSSIHRARFFALILSTVFSSLSFGEIQTSLSMSTPSLTPGTSGSFTATTVSGPAGSTTSTLDAPYAGIYRYILSPGTGRFASLSGTRYGIFFDTFQLFQSFLSANTFTMVNSNTTCPSTSNWTWLLVRFRTPDAPRNAMLADNPNQWFGGSLSYNAASTPVFSSSSEFNLAGPTLNSYSYGYDKSTFGACSNGILKTVNTGKSVLDYYGRWFFGPNSAFFYGADGNPLVATVLPQITLSSGTMTALANQVLSGLFTVFLTKSTQTQTNVYVVPDAAGTTFTLKTINSFTDPTQNTNYGTITCTTLNSPANGFCQGTITLQSVVGTGNAVCHLGSTSTQDLLSCNFQMPGNNHQGGSVVASRSSTGLISVSTPTTAAAVAPNGSTTIVATLQNLTGSYVSTLGNPSVPAQQLQAPFSNSGAWAGTGGTCGATLKGFASCTTNITYAPTVVGTSMQTFRVAYNNQAGTVNATSGITGASGLVSLAISPNSSAFPSGTGQQFTATATYSDSSTQNVSSAVNWSSTNGTVCSIGSTGAAIFASTGSTTIGASLAGVSTSFNTTIYISPPNPTGLTPTVNSYSQITLNWTSGGGTTTAFQIAYQAGATAPADCNSGTVISSGVVGAATSYPISSLQPGTQYSFRVCAVGSVAGALSGGVTTNATTNTPHSLFATSATTNGNIGNLYFADYTCQQEALNSGLTGTWKAILSDSATAASSRISLTQSVYNMRPSGSGGPQLVSTAANFFTVTARSAAANYNSSGGSPGSATTYTGSTTTGGINAGRSCTDWSTSSSGVNGQYGTNTSTTTTWISNNQNTCNNSYSLYCINLQTASAAPPNPTGFTTYTLGPTTVSFTWASGGGTTAAYRLAYTAGGTAPVNCTSGTVISPSTLGRNPTSYTVSGLTASTQYSFRLCAYNSDLSSSSSGSTITVNTLAPGQAVAIDLTYKQVVFATGSTYRGDIGGLYFADFTCQTEATAAGLSGIWKAIMSDDSTNAVSRIAIPANVYNNRSLASGGIQVVASDASAFWSSSLAFPLSYNAGGSAPGSTLTWTGSNANGTKVASTNCSNWSTASATPKGQYGTNTATGNGISTGNNACNNLYTIYCTNQQTASATPPDPTGFTWYQVASNSVSLSWASGGGTTAAYQISYQTGASAPADCNSGTVVTAATLGRNPTSYSVTGLSEVTQYSFRICAFNSDLSASSTGTTFTITTLDSNETPQSNLGTRQIVFSTSGQYQGNFGGFYFADFACQNEATSAGLSGIWKAVLSDESTAASSRISISGSTYNNRPAASGGAQLIASDSAGFYLNFQNAANYNATGGAPGLNNFAWTGTSNTGGISAGFTCSSWSTSVSSVRGLSAANYSGMGGTNNTCNGRYAFYCTNQQTASSAPPNPAMFSAYSVGSTSVGFVWSTGGGTTAAYQIAYQTGGTAPANCNSGSIISAASIGVNATSYVVSGLNDSTQYSFRLCALNSDSSQISSGRTVTVTTEDVTSAAAVDYTGIQVVFATATTYNGSFGGLYYGDYICQREAINAGLPGIWKALLSDDSTSAFARLTVTGPIYNNVPITTGPIQRIASDSANFWSPVFPAALNYTGTGGTPSTTNTWTGSSSAGAIKTGFTCNSWTTNSAAVRAEYATSSSVLNTNIFDNTNGACNNAMTMYCLNGQSSSSTPSDPASFTNGTVTTSTVPLSWTSGGGTTAAYQIAYQTGASAPANCNSGTVIGAPILGINPTSYTVTGLNPGTQYSFRLCAENSDLSAASTGLTLTVTTTALAPTSNQTVFTSSSTYRSTFGGLYFADFVCQTEATNAALGGIWRAILSDASVTAASRITLTSAIYNNRPVGSGGAQQIATNATFWSGAHTANTNYNAAGGAPGSATVFTGATAAGGINAGRVCSSWTNNTSSTNAEVGSATGVTATTMFANGTTNCGNLASVYCIDNQTSAAAPPDPTGFATYAVTSQSIGFLWSSGGGTTAAYQMAYQTGGTAPANCNSGTIVTASTLGYNPSTYTISGLSSGTQYSIRLCAANSDLSSFSSGVTLTVTTQALGNPTSYSIGSTQFIFTTTGTYRGNFGGIYFGDYICQTEATTAGLSGVWKSVLSDSSSNASTRLSLSGTMYNFRVGASGGSLRVSDSTNFWNNLFYNPVTYTALGLNPTQTTSWTGSTSAGVATANTCSDWKSQASTVNGQYGTNSSATTPMSTGTRACNNLTSIYCVNQQTASSAPPNPATFTAYSTGSTTVGLAWTSGGGTTAAYQLSYQTGGTAPADCNTGTVISATTLGLNPTTVTVSSLSPSTQYSFLLCALNSDLSASSAGRTLTVTTTASGTTLSPGTLQFLFTTAGSYQGNFGGIYYADFICQNEADTAGLTGVWKAIISDDSTSASSRLSFSSSIYNTRPANSGGSQLVSDGSGFWLGPWSNVANYTVAGGTPPSTRTWTGTTNTGAANVGNTCTNWTVGASTTNGIFGAPGTVTTTIPNGTANCTGTYAMFCINQQTASSAPPNPTGFSNLSLGSNFVSLVWASGGGTTAGYKLAYQTGGTAPASCSAGTVVSATTLGVNPTTYTVTGLANSTQYSFRLCAVNSDQSSVSSGTTLTLTTLASGASTTFNFGSNQFIFATTATYYGQFGGVSFADYICQSDATSAGLTGTWLALMSDSSTNANARISLSGKLYNLRPGSSGGIQRVSDSLSFWNGTTIANAFNFTPSGAAPGSIYGWTGSSAAGALNAANTCSSWTTSSSATNGVVGRSSATTAYVNFTNTACNTNRTLFCINQQTSPATPSDPTGFTTYSITSSSIGFTWISGGGTTAAYKLAYQAGASAPANCNTGTVVGAATLGVNPSSYAVTGLSSNTQYSFRLCALNSDLTASSTGTTLTVSTLASGSQFTSGSNQYSFVTSLAYAANFGGLYFADFICQNEANAAGLDGVWKALLGDDTTAATTHASISLSIYNLRPAASGGSQLIGTSSYLFSGVLLNTLRYTASGGTPASTRAWTGATASGALNNGRTCTNWTSNSGAVTGATGTNSSLTTAWVSSANSACNGTYGLYCFNQQTASAAPPDPSAFTKGTVTASTAVLNWTSGGGTTAAYKIAYQLGALAPADCTTGTIIQSSTLGVNPITYTVTGLSSATQYSFRLCAYNSDLSSASAGLTQTFTTN